jgi:formate hydrogenlyase subunit 3/multisubunit Na+/H+ antiporter MnhD subunit
LASYPAGALLLALGPDALKTSLLGYGLILLALITYAPLIGSSLQRIVGEELQKLDEFELRLRGRAMGIAFAVFTGLVLLLVLYAAIASDTGTWFPTNYDEFNGVFWGVFLYATVLPIAVLSWIVDPSFNQEQDA